MPNSDATCTTSRKGLRCLVGWNILISNFLRLKEQSLEPWAAQARNGPQYITPWPFPTYLRLQQAHVTSNKCLMCATNSDITIVIVHHLREQGSNTPTPASSTRHGIAYRLFPMRCGADIDEDTLTTSKVNLMYYGAAPELACIL